MVKSASVKLGSFPKKGPTSRCNEQQVSATFQDLPDLPMLKILKFLSWRDLFTSVRHVSFALHDLATDASLWRHVDFGKFYRADELAQVLRRFKDSIRTIKLEANKDFPETLAKILESGITFDEITIKENYIGTTSFHTPSLALDLAGKTKTLALRRFKLPVLPSNFTFATLPRLTSLVSLDLSDCTLVCDKWIRMVVVCCPKLELLNLDGVRVLSNKSVMAIANGLDHLKALFIQGDAVVDDAFAYLFDKKPLLTAFGASQAMLMGDHSFVKFWQMSKLQYLRVGLALEVTEAAILGTFQRGRFPHLKTLNLCNVSLAVSRAIALACPNLEWLTAYDSRVDDAGVSFLINSCPNLRVLELYGGKIIRGDGWLEDVGATLPKLQYVKVNWCDGSKEKIDAAQRLYPRIHIRGINGCYFAPHPYDGRLKLNGITFMDIVNEAPSLSDLKMEQVTFPDVVGEALRRELENRDDM